MKQLKQFCAAGLLTLAIGVTAFAGDISSPAVTVPPPPPPADTYSAPTPAPGDILTPGSTPTTDTVTNLAVMLLLSIL